MYRVDNTDELPMRNEYPLRKNVPLYIVGVESTLIYDVIKTLFVMLKFEANSLFIRIRGSLTDRKRECSFLGFSVLVSVVIYTEKSLRKLRNVQRIS